MKKKFIAILMVAAMAASLLVGCGGTGTESAPADGDAAAAEGAEEASGEFKLAGGESLEEWGALVKEAYGGTKLTAAVVAHPSTEAFQAMAADFTALTGIDVEFDVVEETNLKNKQLLDVQGAGAYDVMSVDAFWMSEYASKNVLDPISEYAENAEITPEWFDYEDIMAAYRNGIAGAGGVNYGIPVAGETRFIAYRTDLFEKYGKEAPKTMDEFLELAQFFNGKEDGLYGATMRAQRGIHFASGWMSLMYNFGGGYVDQSTIGTDEVKVTCNSDQTKESLQFFVDLLQCAPPDSGTYTHEEALSAFTSGKAAMWLDATALAGQITDPATSTVADKVAFVPTPTGPEGDGAALAGWSLGISSKSANKGAAWAFISYMASKEMSKTYVENGGVATRASNFEDPDLQAANPSFEAQMLALESANGLVEKGLSWIPQIDTSNQILDIVGGYGCSAYAGEISVDEAIEGMQKDVEDLLAQ